MPGEHILPDLHCFRRFVLKRNGALGCIPAARSEAGNPRHDVPNDTQALDNIVKHDQRGLTDSSLSPISQPRIFLHIPFCAVWLFHLQCDFSAAI